MGSSETDSIQENLEALDGLLSVFRNGKRLFQPITKRFLILKRLYSKKSE
jgi:hypothetical protein